LVPESCHPYKAEHGQCSDSCKFDKMTFPYKVDSFSYLGGAYGLSDEISMMKELMNNGPFVVSIEPDYNFMYYKSGIYNSDTFTNWFTNKTQVPEWRKVDHSVLLVGWGVEEKTNHKFWLIQNSWGSDWGENGFVRLRRGVDELNVESMAEVATVIRK
jgi:cathepsin C